MDIAREYMGTMGGCQEENKEENQEAQQECWGFGKQRSKWSEARAVFLTKPDQILEGEPGSVIYAPVEIQNQTKWPWKRGCFIGLLDRNAKSELLVGDTPIEFDVRGL